MTVVASRSTHSTWPLAAWAENSSFSDIQSMLRTGGDPELISFALGLPDPRLLPGMECAAALQWIVENEANALQYAPPLEVLKEQIIELMRCRGVECSKEHICLTAGAQQGLNLLARLLIRRGTPVMTESAIYPGFRQVLETCEAEAATVCSDPESGIDIDHLESMLAAGCRPAFLFVNAGPHNPLTVSMNMEQRAHLVELAANYGFPIVEDDAYGLLNYDGASPPPLRALDDRIVCYVGSLSKILAPALRVGWIVAPKWLMPKLAILKEASDLDVATLSQRTATRLFSVIGVDAHLEALCSAYCARRDKMLEALQAEMSRYASWHRPSGGFFIWVRLKDSLNARCVLERAVEQKVAFMPGAAFSLGDEQPWKNCLRLSFSSLAPELIQEGIHRLAKCLESMQAHVGAAVSNA